MRHLALLLAILATPVGAQLVPGDIGVTGFSFTKFSVIDAGGVTAYSVGSFGGGQTQAILWDDQNPDDFIIGGVGFIGRATITGPGTATYTLLTTAIGQATQLSWGPNHEIVTPDQVTDQILAWDETSSSVVPITSGNQPWGYTVNAGTYDPNTGKYYVGNDGSVYNYMPGAPPALFATGWTTGTSFVSGIVIEPGSGDIIVTADTSPSSPISHVLRISPAGVISPNDVVPPGSISRPNSIALDTINGNFIIGADGGSVYSVPFGSALATPTLVVTVTSQGSSVSGVSVVGPSAPPSFSISVTADPTGAALFDLSNIPAGTSDGWTFISGDTTVPPGMGWAFGITPDPLTYLILNIALVPQPGNLFHWLYGITGVYPDVPFAFPPGTLTPLSGQPFDFVALALDPSFAIIGASNAQRVLIP